jgi:hypothetical protein
LRPCRGGPLFLARPVAALAGLACRPASYRRARRARQAGPVFEGKGAEHLTALGGRVVQKIGRLALFRRPDESGAGFLPAWAREAGRIPAPLSRRQGCVCFQNLLQSNSHSRLLPVPEVSCLASRKRSPTENSEEPKRRFLAVLGGYFLPRFGWTAQSSADDSDYRRCFFGFCSSAKFEICG